MPLLTGSLLVMRRPFSRSFRWKAESSRLVVAPSPAL